MTTREYTPNSAVCEHCAYGVKLVGSNHWLMQNSKGKFKVIACAAMQGGSAMASPRRAVSK